MRQDIRIKTVPAIPGLRFHYGGRIYVTGRNGAFTVRNALRRKVISQMKMVPRHLRSGGQAKFRRWYGGASNAADSKKPLKATVDIYRPVTFGFQAKGHVVPATQLDSMTVKRIDGLVLTLRPAELEKTVLLQTTTIVPLEGVLVVKKLLYRVLSVQIGGNNVVNTAQQSFVPANARHVEVKLLFYTTRFTSRDMIFRFAIGSSVKLVYPNGRVSTVPLKSGEASIPVLPRGQYHVSVNALGYSPPNPVSITRDQHAVLSVFSLIDAIFVFGLGTATAVALLFARRPRLRRSVLSKVGVG